MFFSRGYIVNQNSQGMISNDLYGDNGDILILQSACAHYIANRGRVDKG
jgi:hypothetical protein